MVVLVLALDTSTPVVTAGLVELLRPHEISHDVSHRQPVSAPRHPWRVLADKTVTDAFGHAENLMPLATATLAETDHSIRNLDALVVGVGPGPFTGLRVGIATAASLGDALDIPVHGVVSHDPVGAALNADGVAGPVLVATDARRREVYVSVYARTGQRIHGPEVLAPAALPDMLLERDLAPVAIAGVGAEIAASVLDLPTVQPASGWSGFAVACAARPLLTGAVPGPLEPLYLRRPDAEEPHRPKAALPADHRPAPTR